MAADLVEFLRARLDEDEAEIESPWPYTRQRLTIGAHRAILAEHSPDPDTPQLANWCKTCDEGFYPCRTARLLAAIYRDHPDYDPAWAPDAK